MSVKAQCNLNSSSGSLLLSHTSSPPPEMKRSDLFRMVDMAIEIEKERAKVLDAMNARDATVGRLGEAFNSLRQKTALLERLQRESKLTGTADHGLELFDQDREESLSSEVLKLRQEIDSLENTIQDLRDEVKLLKESSTLSGYEDHEIKACTTRAPLFFLSNRQGYHRKNGSTPRITSIARSIWLLPKILLSAVISPLLLYSLAFHLKLPLPPVPATAVVRPSSMSMMMIWTSRCIVRSTPSAEAQDVIQSRNKLLASLPLPDNTPEDALKPIMLPSHLALHEFLSNAPADLRHRLPRYHVLDEMTTYWCPQREEHGYFLTPAFKCTTHPRVNTAHQWSAADVFEGMMKPTDCFYNKNGIWYYAGVYRAFRLDDLTIKEWEALSQEITLSLCKETLAGRKSMSPQNVYEVAQLYGAGALKIACIGLQCVGFNGDMYRSILTLVDGSGQNSKLKQNPVHSHGRGASRDVADAIANLQVATHMEKEA
ncbi:hypothetical protein L218DRAFT_1075448 [Marasmius fiardii PR-910]|nr:hypothetical protein L218DRAFT_1075448 [Marasmius fiardii PR-910]